MAIGIRNPFFEKRSADIPEKVFIEREGGQYFYSEEMPGGINMQIQNVLNGYYACQNYIELFYSLPEVFSPIHEIAKRVSDATWQLRKERNDEVVYDDPFFNKLFSQPNPLVSFKDFVYQSVCYEILVGRQLWFFNRPKTLAKDYKNIIGWWNIPSHEVTVDMKKGFDPYTATSISDFVNEYQLSMNGGIRHFNVDEILPICHFDLRNGHDLNKVKSHLSGAEKAIRNLIPVYEARGIIYIKRGAMGLWVSKKSDNSGLIALTPKEAKDAAAQVNADYGLTNNKATIGVTSVPVEFIKTSMSIAEMQPFEETLADAVAIYKVLRVPRHLVPSKDNSTFANADADMKSFYTDVIIPWAKRYAESWTNYMKLSDFKRYIYPDYSHIEVLTDNRRQKAQYDAIEGNTYLQRWQNGACSLNDWITANGDAEIIGDPVYSKKILEYTPEELQRVKDIINMKTGPTGKESPIPTPQTNAI